MDSENVIVIDRVEKEKTAGEITTARPKANAIDATTIKAEDLHWTKAFNLTVLVAALGYFVDMFDITIYGVVRIASLKDLGIVEPAALLSAGVTIYNWQMIGMTLGGILWGMMGDKKGRLSVLFGSILLYSLGNIATVFVWDVNSYAFCRFITGIGLAGELGAAITLVAESLPKQLRGVGTTIVATLGLTGAIAAALIGQNLSWKAAYILGGVMGLALLLTRFKMRESTMFKSVESKSLRKGDVTLLLNPKRFVKYLFCILIGTPIYFITGILFTFSPEITAGLNIQGTVTAGNALLFGTIGLALGDMLCGMTSQYLKSRKKALVLSLGVALVTMLAYLFGDGARSETIYGLCFILGLAAGYWAVLITVAAEQFGTNIRATVATTVPNFVRGSAVLCTLGFLSLKNHIDVASAALWIGGIAFTLAFVGVFLMKETFDTNLDFVEE